MNGRMRPMSLFESKESIGVVSLRGLFDGNHKIEAVSKLEIPHIAHLICRGRCAGMVSLFKVENNCQDLGQKAIGGSFHCDGYYAG